MFITRQPLINCQGNIIATRLSLYNNDKLSENGLVVALSALTDSWPVSERAIFINYEGATSGMGLIGWSAPPNVSFELPGAAFAGAQAQELVQAAKTARLSLCYQFDNHAADAFGSGALFRFVGFDATRFPPAKLKPLLVTTQQYGVPFAFNVDSQQGYTDSMNVGMNAAAGWFVKHPVQPPAAKLNASQLQIVRLLNLVRENADVSVIETALKRDVALAYKLLRYINSAGLGLSCEVQSFKHAVTILGYNKLNKWLALLLLTATKDPMAPTLMHTALTRGRMMEHLGRGLVDESEYDNLFITGTFSVLDLLLGASMESVLDAMLLPESINDALAGEGGMYAPFLSLTIACEDGDGAAVAEQAAMLGLTGEQVNRAHLIALSFADRMEI